MFEKLGRKPVRKQAAVDEPSFPDPLDYLWSFFWELRIGITSGGMDYPTATWADIHYWAVEMRVALFSWEKIALMRLSQLQAAIESEPKPKPPTAP